MKFRFTLLNFLLTLAVVSALLSWIPGIKYPALPDGYVWSSQQLTCHYPQTPREYPDRVIEFSETNQSFNNGTELFRHYFHQGWWICRRNFVEETAGYPFDGNEWKYIDDLSTLPDDHPGKFPQMAMRDGCRACSHQIDQLLQKHSIDQLRDRLISSTIDRYIVPLISTVLVVTLIAFKLYRLRKRPETAE